MMRDTSFGAMQQLQFSTPLSGKCEVMHFVNQGKPHTHDVDEVAISVAGSGTVVIASLPEPREVHLEAGESVVIPAGLSHYMYPDAETVCWSMLIAYATPASPASLSPEASKAWQKFMDAGLLWWVNHGLHLFGWAIEVLCEDTGEPISVAPRHGVTYRGFPRDSEEEGYEKLSKHLADNAADTHKGVDWRS